MKRHPVSPGCLSGALTLGAGTASAAGDPHWAEVGTAYTDTLGGGQGPASIPLDLRIKGSATSTSTG